MATCDACKKTILFGGIKESGFRFCSKKCVADGHVLIAATKLPDDLVRKKAMEIHSGSCPICEQNRGPVDIHTAHKIWSLVLISSWTSNAQVSCRPCGRKRQLYGAVSSVVAGWWGIPWGLIMTPVQIGKNLVAILRSQDSLHPSEKLEQFVRLELATQVHEQGRRHS